MWRCREHIGDQEAEQEENGSQVDNVAHDLTKRKWRRFFKVTNDADGAAVMHSARNADDVRRQEATVTNGLDVEEGGS